MEKIEKIDIIKKSTTIVYGNGLVNAPTAEYVNVERGLIHLNDQINKLIDVVNELQSKHHD